jgi:hypothetical protein
MAPGRQHERSGRRSIGRRAGGGAAVVGRLVAVLAVVSVAASCGSGRSDSSSAPSPAEGAGGGGSGSDLAAGWWDCGGDRAPAAGPAGTAVAGPRRACDWAVDDLARRVQARYGSVGAVGPGSGARSVDDGAGSAAYAAVRSQAAGRGVALADVAVADHVVLQVTGRSGGLAAGTTVEVRDAAGGATVALVRTGADGRALFVPRRAGSFRASAGSGPPVAFTAGPGATAPVALTAGPPRAPGPPSPVDLVLVLDVTRSTAGQLARLQAAAGDLVGRLDGVRTGLVVYRDEGEAFVVRTFAPTSDGAGFAAALGAVTAEGGGDTPEGLVPALAELGRVAWRPDAIRLAVVVGDAPPHLATGPDRVAAGDALADLARLGVRVSAVAADGQDERGELAFRDLAMVTGGRFHRLGPDGSGVDVGGGPSRSIAELIAAEVVRSAT